ncbi:protein phosphatase 1 regulatory subunit 12A isoform X1 [Scleropages formosus]|uniref:protein phosphatase 1 regulatory subunit 12A isoform X1 n=1 Tax=Scleropages formosus TaxID=113540 RepID=UPI0008780C84|nr:protein phosphatase 1 regulatory subunit 12A isoform X1 [Scleropages formosus]
MKMADAKQKRNEQLKRWLGSETDREPPVLKKKKTKVKFDDSAVFLAACSSGDTEEVLRMLERGADIDCANVDGLTALHQACIDDNLDMVIFLVEHGACVNQPDNEGWIPLHAAASCGYLDIAEYLISQGANVGVVNSEGETPLDIAEEEAMEELLQNEINRQGVDIETARKEEERIMLRDARQWLNSGHIADTRHAKSGGTALHVAAAKGYTEVLKLLIQAGYDVNVKDYDGWTPLHAAAHWGKEEACRMLVESLCDMDAVNKVGQTAFDVADEDVLGYLEELQKKQTLLLSEKREKKSPLIETTTKVDNNQPLKPLNKETLLLEPEKTVPRIESLEPEKADDGEQEGKKDESSCSSEEEEEEDSESEAEADKSKPPTTVHNTNSNAPVAPPSVTVSSPTSPTNQVVPTSPVKKFPSTTGKVSPKEEERKDESPASWRLGLRKTGSYGALAEITGSKEAQKKDTVGVMRSASSPRLSSSLDNKDKEKEKDKGTRLAYVTPTIPSRRINSMTDIDEKENRDTAGSLARSGSYTRRRWEEETKNNEGSSLQNRMPSYQRSLSHSLAVGRTSSTRDLPAKSSSTTSLDPNSCNTKPWQWPSAQYSSYSVHRSSSFGRRQDDALNSSITSSPTSTTTTFTTPSSSSTLTSPTGHRSLLSGSSFRTSSSSRYWPEENTDKEKEREKESAAVIPTIVNTASTTTGTFSSSDGRERRRSYLTPVRDEESESQRKARSRQARQTRRSTQGVTLTDLQEAEKTIGRSRSSRAREEEKEEKQDKEKKETESKENDYRSKYRSFEETYSRYKPCSTTSATTTSLSSSTSMLSTSSASQPSSLTGIASAYSRSSQEGEKESDQKDEGEKEGEDKSQTRTIRERRRPREKRRSTGVPVWNRDSDENDPEQQSDSEDSSTRSEPQSDRLPRNDLGLTSTTSTERYDYLGRSSRESRSLYSSRLDKDDTTDYKKLYEQILAENEKLKAQLRDMELELTDLKLQLEKATQRQERFAERSQLEMEKREKRALERKIADMEEELKDKNPVPVVKKGSLNGSCGSAMMLPDLKADNQRLKDENGALIRVISKLSK